MKKRIMIAGILLGLMFSMTACGSETVKNIEENNEVNMGINLENKAGDLVDQNNETNQNLDNALDVPSGE